MPSLWNADRIESATPPGADNAVDSADVVIIGAGITGLTSAVLLARAGKRVVVVEARWVGAGTTGNTTGKVSALQGTKLARIAAKHGHDVLTAYVTGNVEGRDWLLRHCDVHGLDVQRADDHAYAQDRHGLATAKATLAACRTAGLHDARWVQRADVPFPFVGGVQLPAQAQLDPMPLLNSLVVELELHGGSVLQGTRAVSVTGLDPLQVHVRRPAVPDDEGWSISARQCILATGTPILDRGLFFARLTPQRSYCMAFDAPGDITRSMFISVDSPTRSVRHAPTPAGDRLIVGGAGHVVGRAQSPAKGIAELTDWVQQHYPGATRTHFWSAQDYTPAGDLPYVGPLLPKLESIQVATGFDKWGMSNGVAAALALSARLLGGRMDWADAFASWSPHDVSGTPTALRANLEVGLNLAKGWLAPLTRPAVAPSEGHGAVSGPPWRLRAECVVDGVTHAVSPVCPHLGGIVTFNDADRAWECPLHGSRFAPDGALLEGPATHGLSRADVDRLRVDSRSGGQ